MLSYPLQHPRVTGLQVDELQLHGLLPAVCNLHAGTVLPRPHLKGPAPQGWACTFYQHDAARLQKGEAGRPWRSRRSGLAELLSHESLRLRTVRMALDRLCDEVTVGSEMDFRQCPWTDSRLLLP